MSKDLLERAKALRSSAFGTHKQALDVVDELIAEVEDLRGKYQYMVDNAAANKLDGYRALGKRAADAEAEVERLRSENKIISDRAAHHEKQDAAEIELLAARIKELEADRIEARAQYLLFMNDNPGCIAWNFDELDETEQDALREQARYMLELEEPWVYIQLREAREQIKRLEAEFLGATKEIVYATHEGRDAPEGEDAYAEKVAREALERIKAGGKDD